MRETSLDIIETLTLVEEVGDILNGGEVIRVYLKLDKFALQPIIAKNEWFKELKSSYDDSVNELLINNSKESDNQKISLALSIPVSVSDKKVIQDIFLYRGQEYLACMKMVDTLIRNNLDIKNYNYCYIDSEVSFNIVLDF